jgi:hypothetical protein
VNAGSEHAVQSTGKGEWVDRNIVGKKGEAQGVQEGSCRQSQRIASTEPGKTQLVCDHVKKRGSTVHTYMCLAATM